MKELNTISSAIPVSKYLKYRSDKQQDDKTIYIFIFTILNTIDHGASEACPALIDKGLGRCGLLIFSPRQNIPILKITKAFYFYCIIE